MAEQERKTARRPKPPDDEPTPNPAVAEKGKKMKKDLDELLEEIDSVLEQNAEEFVRGYVQRGGE